MHPFPQLAKVRSIVLLFGLTCLLIVAGGCRKEEVAEDPSLPQPDVYVAPPSEVPPDAATNPATDGPVNRNAPPAVQSTGDEVVDKPDPTGD